MQLRLANEAGIGDWSDPLRVTTLPSAETSRLNISAVAINGRSVRIDVLPQCPYFGPLELSYYRYGSDDPEAHGSYDAERVLTSVQLDGFMPNTRAKVCVGRGEID